MNDILSDREFMGRAIELARQARVSGEIPVGAVLVENGHILGEGSNCPIACNDSSAHAEIVAIRNAGQRKGNYRLAGTTLYVSLEPCIMCAGAILHARIQRVVFAARDDRFGAAGSQLNLLESEFLNHRCSVTAGVLESQSRELLQEFFRDRRKS